jgi:hypothetical protein
MLTKYTSFMPNGAIAGDGQGNQLFTPACNKYGKHGKVGSQHTYRIYGAYCAKRIGEVKAASDDEAIQLANQVLEQAED